jgi:hypothetical protein
VLGGAGAALPPAGAGGAGGRRGGRRDAARQPAAGAEGAHLLAASSHHRPRRDLGAPVAGHAGHAPQVLAAFRNTAIGLLRALGATQIAAACRRFMARPPAALLAVGLLHDLE